MHASSIIAHNAFSLNAFLPVPSACMAAWSPPSGPPTKRKFPVRPAPLTTDRERSPFLLSGQADPGSAPSPRWNLRAPPEFTRRTFTLPNDAWTVVDSRARGVVGTQSWNAVRRV